MVVLGIPPTRPETGFGYVERMETRLAGTRISGLRGTPFHRKARTGACKEYLASGNYHWNAGMFFWRVSTFLDALKNYLPKTTS